MVQHCVVAALADQADVVLDQDLETVPAVPIDLDAVGEADPLLVVSSGCSALDVKDGAGPRTTKTIAVPASAAAHERSPYAASAATTRLAQSYVVTAGIDVLSDGSLVRALKGVDPFTGRAIETARKG